MKRIAGLIFLLCTYFPLSAQEFDTLTYASFMDWVRIYHPIAAQAEINLRMGDMEVLQARGGFDPLVYGNLDNKEYNGTTYYDRRDVGVDIPTWGGVELNGVYEQNTGNYLNPERVSPSDGLFAVGASVNLGQGLILDQRRAALRQAEIYQQSTASQRLQLLNGLYLQATDMYWRWALAYANQLVLEEGVDLAAERFEAVKISFEQGDLPAIDTVEAYSQLLNREYRLQEAENNFFARTQELNTFLWDSETNPMFLDPSVVPESLDLEQLQLLDETELRVMVSSHPDIQVADFELASLDVERRLRAQEILPVVKVKYNFLTQDLGDFQRSRFFENDYKWGLTIYTPIMWRRARGGLGLTKAKIDYQQNSRELTAFELRTKLESEINNWTVLNSQVFTFQRNVESLEALLQGEARRFEIGESSLFLVNAREVSVFDSRLTLNELISKRKIAYAKARYAAGIGFE